MDNEADRKQTDALRALMRGVSRAEPDPGHVQRVMDGVAADGLAVVSDAASPSVVAVAVRRVAGCMVGRVCRGAGPGPGGDRGGVDGRAGGVVRTVCGRSSGGGPDGGPVGRDHAGGTVVVRIRSHDAQGICPPAPLAAEDAAVRTAGKGGRRVAGACGGGDARAGVRRLLRPACAVHGACRTRRGPGFRSAG